MHKLVQAGASIHSTTGQVSLRESVDAIFEGFEKRCQKDIKRAARKGLLIRQAVTEEEAKQLRDLRREMAAQKNLDDSGQPDLLDQWRSFREDEEGVFLLAEAEGRLIGGLAVVKEGGRAVIRGGGTLPILTKIPRTHNLIWESMRLMRDKGCEVYDLAGMPDDEGIEEDERRRQVFKLAFNPKIVKLVPTYFAVLRPIDHALFFRARQWYRRSSLRRLVAPLLKRDQPGR
jgi:lipid II:glycine glycyltransferase (peptidoglycan interpeptide bridge formation enzyme)